MSSLVIFLSILYIWYIWCLVCNTNVMSLTRTIIGGSGCLELCLYGMATLSNQSAVSGWIWSPTQEEGPTCSGSSPVVSTIWSKSAGRSSPSSPISRSLSPGVHLITALITVCLSPVSDSTQSAHFRREIFCSRKMIILESSQHWLTDCILLSIHWTDLDIYYTLT